MIKFGSLNVKDIRIGEQQVKKVAVGSEIIWEKSTSPLPSGYRQVEYLESNGSQWINTQIIPNLDLKGEIEFARITGGSGTNYYPFGSTNGANKDYWFVGIVTAQNLLKGAWFYLGTASSYNDYGHIMELTAPLNEKIKVIVNDDKKFYYNDVLAYDYINNTRVTYDFTAAKPIYLFRLNYSSPEPKPTRIFSAKFTSNQTGENIGNFITCLDNNDRPCMFDLVTRQTLYNQGTGEFGYETMDGTVVAPI